MSVEHGVVADESLDIGARRSWAGQRADLALAGWVAAAVLAAIAPYRAVFAVQDPRTSGRNERMITGVDGWGHTPIFLASHSGARFGSLLWACAAAMVALSVYAVIARRGGRRDSSRRILDLAAVAATAMLAGVVASLVVYATGLQSSVHVPGQPLSPS
jgi:hypothetical protein